jgi:hypothetical protein
MGIAKSIEAYSVCKNYNTDIDIFIKYLSDRLNADLIINKFDKDYKHIGKKNIGTNFKKENKYYLTITYDEYKIGENLRQLPSYEISIPIKHCYDDYIEFNFYPNHSVHIMFLTFEHLWRTFIETLKFQAAYQDRQEAIGRYQILRREYSNILLKIDISKIFITTHAYYEIESITYEKLFPELTFKDIIEVAKEKDKFNIFDFQQILDTDSELQLDKSFIETPDLNILLLDTLISE